MVLDDFFLCVLGCFLVLGLEDKYAMRLCYGRVAAFHIECMLEFVGYGRGFLLTGSVLLGFQWFFHGSF